MTSAATKQRRWSDDDVREKYWPCDSQGNLCRACADAIKREHEQTRADLARLARLLREAIHIGALETPQTFELILTEMGL